MLTVSPTRLGTSEAAWAGDPNLDAVADRSIDELLDGCDRVVVVAPHPDDEVLGAGGLIRAAHRSGRLVEIVAVTDGEASHPGSGWSGEAMAERRRGETDVALARLGVPGTTVHRLGIADGWVRAQEGALGARLAQLLDPATACVTTWRHDGHPDHDAAGRASAAAAGRVRSRVLEYPVWAWHWARPGVGLPYRHARRLRLDADARRSKIDAVAAFTSQIRPLGPAPAEREVLPPAVRLRFERPFEIHVVAGDR